MKNKHHILVAVLLSIGLLGGNILYAETYSGTCGATGNETNVTWLLNTTDSTLTISGTGAMGSYDYNTYPWYDYRDYIKKVIIGNNITTIGAYTFYACPNMTSFNTGNGVTAIGKGAVGHCPKLVELNLGNHVGTIGDYVFEECHSLKKLIIPVSISNFPSNAISGTIALTDIYVSWTTADAILSWSAADGWWEVHENTVLHIPCGTGEYYRAKGWGPFNFAGSDGANYTLTVQSTGHTLGTVKIDDGTAAATVNKSVHCEDTHIVTAIGAITTGGCCYFKQWLDGNTDNPRKIGLNANKTLTAEFAEGVAGGVCGAADDNLTWLLSCDSILTISGTGAMKNWGNSSTVPWYDYRDYIKTVNLPDGLTTIGKYAFYGCTNLQNISLPNGLQSIGNHAFYNCNSLPSVTIPASVTLIEDDAYLRCWSLESMVVEEGNSNYDSRNNCNAIIQKSNNCLLYGCKNTIIPNTVTIIRKYAFDHCHGLISIDIPSSVTSIGKQTFKQCENLTDIYLHWTTDDIMKYEYSASYQQNELYCWENTASAPDPLPVVYVHIPCGQESAYINKNWHKRFTLVEDNGLKLCSADPAMGLVQLGAAAPRDTLSARVLCGDTIIAAVPTDENNYHFVQWSDGNTDNPRKISIACDSTFTAEFEITIPTAIDQTSSSSIQEGNRGRLILRDNQLFILRGDKTYTVTGQEVK